MSLSIYERNIKYGRTILITGIPMLFEKSMDFQCPDFQDWDFANLL